MKDDKAKIDTSLSGNPLKIDPMVLGRALVSLVKSLTKADCHLLSFGDSNVVFGVRFLDFMVSFNPTTLGVRHKEGERWARTHTISGDYADEIARLVKEYMETPPSPFD